VPADRQGRATEKPASVDRREPPDTGSARPTLIFGGRRLGLADTRSNELSAYDVQAGTLAARHTDIFNAYNSRLTSIIRLSEE
jgi:hypothetical protein